MEEIKNEQLKTTEPVDGSEKEKGGVKSKDLMKKWFYVGLGVLAVIVVIVLIIVNLSSAAPETGEAEITDNVTDKTTEMVNTELAAGTAEVVIDGKTVQYAGAYVVDGIEATISSGTYESTKDDEVVFLVVNGGSLVIDGDVKINKSGSENFEGRGDAYSFYGTNSAVVVVGDGSSATINGATITTDVSGANAVVATNGGVVGISNSTINTSRDNSRGLHATYQGAIEADTVTISTKGGSSASLATDRGEGTVIADNMTLTTAGAGSPLIYSTGEITVSGSTGTATGAQIAVVEGSNSVTLEDCDFSANGDGNRNNVDNAGVMIYQSMSGDAAMGAGTFTAVNCKLTILPDSDVYMTTPLFFVTNTTATISLTDVEASFYEEGYFVLAAGTDEWGRVGANGGKVTIETANLTATNTNLGMDEISSIVGL